MRLVLDTSVLVAAFRNPEGASAALLRMATQHRYILLATAPLFIEYEEVLTRPAHRSVHQLSDDLLSDALDELASHVLEVRLSFNWRPQAPDPDDDLVLDAAINGFADAIVTFNMRHLWAAAARFGIDVVTPGRIIQERFR